MENSETILAELVVFDESRSHYHIILTIKRIIALCEEVFSSGDLSGFGLIGGLIEGAEIASKQKQQQSYYAECKTLDELIAYRPLNFGIKWDEIFYIKMRASRHFWQDCKMEVKGTVHPSIQWVKEFDLPPMYDNTRKFEMEKEQFTELCEALSKIDSLKGKLTIS
jgi:hypothetical protein